ncbi:amidase signature domain-containing protein [Apiosordaria backusii]|uniref:Amidase signature domain-containing protein n=1 Tax=Apiosordaria backusii TaxID=314023 RepID=A0AA39ZQ59_9PEZI|nr:amidase signature domain-containing protein [Apiosordaria backusii]
MPHGFGCDQIRELIAQYQQDDDVMASSFLTTILLVTTDRTLHDDVIQLLKSLGCKAIYLLTQPLVPKGPFFYSSEGIFRAARLYADTEEAFTLSTSAVSSKEYNRYQTVNASAYGATTLCIAVPSRLYATTKPLAGMRVAVKDVFHLNGVRTTCGNRAYGKLCGPWDVSSAAVQKVLDLGGIVVGKTKTAEFAGSQEVIGDWADYSYAFNARADGYIRCTGSSTGSASAVTAYSWVDIGLGSDAGGSVRDPAVAHGIYGFRPSHDGSLERNTPALCDSKGPHTWAEIYGLGMIDFGQHWLDACHTRTQTFRPLRLLVINEYASDRDDVQKIFDAFVSKLSKWLDVKTTSISLESMWQSTKPDSVPAAESFAAYFSRCFMEVLASDYWSSTARFRDDYKQQFGATPYVCKVTQWLWDFGSSITTDQRQQAITRVGVHNAWFNQQVLGGGDECILLIPRYDLNYRDEYLPPPEQREFFGFDSNLHATFAGLPHLIMPIGQSTFNSVISHREEVFPVSMGIIGSKGTDIGLLRMVEDFLISTGLPTGVLTGKTAFLYHE